MRIRMLLPVSLTSVFFTCFAMDQLTDQKIADCDNPKKAFIVAVREGNFDKLTSEFPNKEDVNDTFEGVAGFPGYAVNTKLTALQWAVERLSASGWGVDGHHFYERKADWENALIKIIQFLLANQADSNKANKCSRCIDWRYSWHPLALAYLNDRYDIFRLLLDYGAMIPLEDLRWIDFTIDPHAYQYVLHLFKTGAERPSYGKVNYTHIPVNQRP